MGKSILGSTEVTQIAVIVRDVEAAARRYAKLFGAEVPPVVLTDPEETAHTRYRGQPTAARAKLAFLPIGTLVLELIEPVDGPSTWQQALQERGEGLHHIAFEVTGMDGVLDGLAAEGIQVLQQGDYTGGRYAYLDSEAAFGMVIELLENYPPTV